MGKNQGGVLTNLIISQLLSAIKYKTWIQINAKTKGCLTNDQILNDRIVIFMNIDDTMSIL